MATQPTTEVEEDPFETLSARFAYDYQEDGAREFKKLMAGIAKSGKIDREAMQTAAVELMVVKLPKVAKLVRDASFKCPSRADRWPYSAPATPINVRAAQASAERKLNRWRKQIGELLVKAGLDWSWLGEGELAESAEGN